MTSLKNRVEKLENANPERPLKVVYQNWDDPTLWHDRPRQEGSEPYTWDGILAQYPDHDFIQVLYVDNWRNPTNDQ